MNLRTTSPAQEQGRKAPSGPCACGARCACPARSAPDPLGMLRASTPQPLPAAVRGALEPRFGADLGAVRVHTGPHAGAATRAIGARAWTTGRDIAFARGEFAPRTARGMGLLVHELGHVLQQRGHAAEQPAWRVSQPHEPAELAADRAASTVLAGGRAHVAPVAAEAGVSVFARQPEEGTAVTRDHAALPVWSAQDRRWHAQVNRITYRNEAEARRAEEEDASVMVLNEAAMDVAWDQNRCEVVVPVRVFARGAKAGELEDLDPGQTPADTVDANLIARVGRRFVTDTNTYFGDWFTAEWSCAGGEATPCAGKRMPIRVEATVAGAGHAYDYELRVSHLTGRSNVVPTTVYSPTGHALLYTGTLGTQRHEASHLALRTNDEYYNLGEANPPPETIDPARVFPDDWSLQNDHHTFGRFALLHRRHFSFAVALLDRVASRMGWRCHAVLRELPRPVLVTVRESVGVGYSTLDGGALAVDVGLGVNVPLTRLREWNLLVGAHLGLLGSLGRDSRTSLLTGMRAGLEYSAHPSGGGVTAGVFTEGGLLHQSGAIGGYVGAGVTAGYAPAPQIPLSVRLEAAAAARPDALSDPWFRLGLALGFRF